MFEHLVEPISDIAKMLEFSKSILFTTNLVPAASLGPRDWWYYGAEHGQHISLYTRQALQHIADEFGLNLYTTG